MIQQFWYTGETVSELRMINDLFGRHLTQLRF